VALGLAAMLAAGPVLAQGAGDGKNRRVTVENLSSQSVKNLYASPVTADTWEEDMLGSEVMPPNSRRAANIDNGTTECMYDLKAVMMDGKEHVRRRVNVCAVSRWVIGDAGDSIS
jgi:hypothetical protein